MLAQALEGKEQEIDIPTLVTEILTNGQGKFILVMSML